MSFYKTCVRRAAQMAGLLGVLSASLSGCGGGGSSNNGGTSGASTTTFVSNLTGSRSVCQLNPAHGDGRAKWTVLVYMNAANNLQPFSVTNIQQMLQVGSDANLNIVVQWKQANVSGANPTFVGTHRYLIHKGTLTTLEQTDRLADPNPGGTVDMGDWHTLQSFVQWGEQTYPADNVALVVWDHGSGWQQTRAVSQDDQAGTEIQTWQLPLALANLPQAIDDLIFDASLEQMTEVAYEVRNNAKVMVASEESPPGTGYPYDQWLSDLKTGVATATPCDLGVGVVNRFVNSYASSAGITQSMIDLTKMNAVASALDAFAVSLLSYTGDTTQSAVIKNAREALPQYGDSEGYVGLRDLYAFADAIRKTTTKTDLQQAALNLETALAGAGTGAILYNGHGPSEAASNGLAIYLPAASFFNATTTLPYSSSVGYSNLALAGATHWDEFLKAQTQ